MPQNGSITYTANATADFDVGTVATYSCDQGYALNVENPSRVCTELVGSGTAIWNGFTPTCLRKSALHNIEQKLLRYLYLAMLQVSLNHVYKNY